MAIARQIDPVPAGVQPTPSQAPVRMGPVGRAMVLGWYLGLCAATVGDALLTGQPASVLAFLFVTISTAAFFVSEDFTVDRAIMRSLLVGSLCLVAGITACLAAGASTHAAAEFLCFGAVSMLMGIMVTLPMAIISLRH